MINRILIQTEIDYTIIKRILHLDENYCWNLEKKKTEINNKYKDSIFSAFHRYWARFTATQKRKKEEGQLPDRPLSKSRMNFFR